MDTFKQVITAIITLMPVMLGVGAAWKWLPGVRKFANEGVIPVLNLVVGLLVAFAGPSTANAGILGDVFHAASGALGGPEKIFAVTVSVLFAALFHDKAIKPLTPPSPATLAIAA